MGALAYRLDDEADRAGGAVDVGDGQRDPLRAGSAAHDHELTGLADLGDPGRLDDEAGHVRRQLLLVDDEMHAAPGLLRRTSVLGNLLSVHYTSR